LREQTIGVTANPWVDRSEPSKCRVARQVPAVAESANNRSWAPAGCLGLAHRLVRAASQSADTGKRRSAMPSRDGSRRSIDGTNSRDPYCTVGVSDDHTTNT
jgi:hypothetical protein